MSLASFGAVGIVEIMITWVLCPLLFLIGGLLRKNLFNDQWSMDFNLLFATILAEIGYLGTLLVIHLIWHYHSLKWALLFGLIGMFIGGLLFKDIWGFGQAGGSGEVNYE